jgi:hypothetical protein
LGFRPVGGYEGVGDKLGRWHDVAWFARPLRSREPEPFTALAAGTACMKEGDRS